MSEDKGACPSGTGLSSASPIEPVPVSPLRASIPSADDGWRRHSGGARPVHRDVIVRFRLRNGSEDVWPAYKLNWQYGTTIWEAGGMRMPAECEIVAYKVESQP